MSMPDRNTTMTALASETALSYLEGHNVMTLATVGPEGPWAAAVFYASDSFTLYFLSSAKSRHSLNIAANPNIAATIQEDYRQWSAIKGIQLEGEASLLSGAESAAALQCYRRKFPFIKAPAQSAIAKALSRISCYRVTPSRLYLIDNSQGFGYREQVL